MKQRGKKCLEWESLRRILKTKFLTWGITSCELRYPGVCWGDNALGFAHAKKRRYLKPHELSHVILCCNPCHDVIESLPHDLMEVEVNEIIRRRKKNLKKDVDLSKSLARLSSCA